MGMHVIIKDFKIKKKKLKYINKSRFVIGIDNFFFLISGGKLHFYTLMPSGERLQNLYLLFAMKETYTMEHHGSVKRV